MLADTRGSVWALTERDCSVQRRYQKVIEESPSPAVGPRLREDLLAAAAAITRSVSYVGPGTAEFLLTPYGQFYFLEFNTRLQVEHPVTECVHGIDLVAIQLDIAQGIALPPRLAVTGHAIEARLYAEDPAAGYLPASGTMHLLHIPDVDTWFTPPTAQTGLRLDSGIESGSEISPHYDPMLAKLIAWAPARQAAARRLATALDRARIHGPATNRNLLVSVLREPRFVTGQADTSRWPTTTWPGWPPARAAVRLSAVAAALADAAAARAAARAGQPARRLAQRGLTAAAQIVRRPGRAETSLLVGSRRDQDRGRRQPDRDRGPQRTPMNRADRRQGPRRADGDADQEPGALNVIAMTEDQVLLEVSGVRHRFDIGGPAASSGWSNT